MEPPVLKPKRSAGEACGDGTQTTSTLGKRSAVLYAHVPSGAYGAAKVRRLRSRPVSCRGVSTLIVHTNVTHACTTARGTEVRQCSVQEVSHSSEGDGSEDMEWVNFQASVDTETEASSESGNEERTEASAGAGVSVRGAEPKASGGGEDVSLSETTLPDRVGPSEAPSLATMGVKRETILCRTCENMVWADELANHMKPCSEAAQCVNDLAKNRDFWNMICTLPLEHRVTQRRRFSKPELHVAKYFWDHPEYPSTAAPDQIRGQLVRRRSLHVFRTCHQWSRPRPIVALELEVMQIIVLGLMEQVDLFRDGDSSFKLRQMEALAHLHDRVSYGLPTENQLRIIKVFDDNVKAGLETVKKGLALREDASKALVASATMPHTFVFKPPSLSDFTNLKKINEGGYGKVYLVRKKRTGDIYALKAVKKSVLGRFGIGESEAERCALALASSCPHLLSVMYIFQSPSQVFFAMDYMTGGDVALLLGHVGCLQERAVVLYVAELVAALEYLHLNGVVHRDVKPDNMMIGTDGHIRLGDFGLSFLGAERWKTFDHSLIQPKDDGIRVVGTPDYIAPETLAGQPGAFEPCVDWWAVGVVLFECMYGYPPFYGNTVPEVFDKITNHHEVDWSDHPLPTPPSPECRDLIDRLLQPDPTRRLGYNGASEVKHHPFFSSIQWDALLDHEPPFVPDVKSEYVSQPSVQVQEAGEMDLVAPAKDPSLVFSMDTPQQIDDARIQSLKLDGADEHFDKVHPTWFEQIVTRVPMEYNNVELLSNRTATNPTAPKGSNSSRGPTPSSAHGQAPQPNSD